MLDMLTKTADIITSLNLFKLLNKTTQNRLLFIPPDK